MKGKGHQQHASRPGAPGGEHRTQVGGSFGGARAPVADRGAGEESEVAALLRPPAQKETYFAANGKTIRTALLDEEAQAMAEKLKELPNTQLRRFYDPVVALRLRAQAGKLDAEQIKAEMAMMKARAAYAYRRPGLKVPAELVKFFTKHAASVDSPEKFVAFARHFEAIVAYHRVHNPQ